MAESDLGNLNYEQIEELMAGYALNALSAEDAAKFDRYLQKHPELIEEAEKWRETASLMAYAPPTISPPDRLRSQIMEGIALNPPRVSFVPTWAKVAIAALSIFSLGVFGDNFFLRRELGIAQNKLDSLRVEETYLFTLKGTTVAPVASGTIFVDELSQKIATGFQNLPPLPAGKSYFLWAVSGDKKIPCGKIDWTGDRMVEAIAIPKISYDEPDIKLILTIESTSNPTTPSPEIIMTGRAI